MGILTKMLGTKIFLLLSLSVLGGYSMPQPELRIIIHLHGVDNFQPGPVGNRIVNPIRLKGPGTMRRRPRIYEKGTDYSDDDAETVDEAGDVVLNGDVIPNEEIKLVGKDEEAGEGSVSGDQAGET